ncbi:hypothetical protein LSAT2_007412 [Lamellibrachia satsuma]|nr:hypothetical protein LSAT2_007412 [Lamellibrachia satsuma]
MSYNSSGRLPVPAPAKSPGRAVPAAETTGGERRDAAQLLLWTINEWSKNKQAQEAAATGRRGKIQRMRAKTPVCGTTLLAYTRPARCLSRARPGYENTTPTPLPWEEFSHNVSKHALGDSNIHIIASKWTSNATFQDIMRGLKQRRDPPRPEAFGAYSITRAGFMATANANPVVLVVAHSDAYLELEWNSETKISSKRIAAIDCLRLSHCSRFHDGVLFLPFRESDPLLLTCIGLLTSKFFISSATAAACVVLDCSVAAKPCTSRAAATVPETLVCTRLYHDSISASVPSIMRN